MSPRAAWRLESLGFSTVYDYAAGKLDWLANGLPTEGRLASQPRVINFLRPDVPTCRWDEAAQGVAARYPTKIERWIVVNGENVVLGRLHRDVISQGSRLQRVEEVMKPGPSTFRPHLSIEEMLDYMLKKEMSEAIITSSEGKLLGLLYLQDVRENLRPD
ncbi:MAG TPA: CBS domain-containing protein [Dehalococcoidia bacterium]|nr:CBS domain-containing protein [Dehalococcoidia bacterium]